MKRILLISTDATVQELLCANSSLLNAEVEVNECTQDLLQKIKQHKPDVLVIDFILNDENGGGLCKTHQQTTTKKKKHTTPTIFFLIIYYNTPTTAVACVTR
jgi:DNA-binding response OmpR family regulator